MPSPHGSAVLLGRLEREKPRYGGGAGASKLDLLRRLETRRLATADQVARLHEVLCFLRAYPDDRRLLAVVERMLAGFSRRPDLRRHRGSLRDSGIAGTEIRYPFFAFTAEWLARRWGRHLQVDWRAFDQKERLAPLVPLLAHYAETPALDEYDLPIREWVARLKGRDETDAAFLVRRFETVLPDPFVREAVVEALDLPIVVSPGPDTPSRTHARHPGLPVAFQTKPLDRSRPSLRDEVQRPPRSVRAVGPGEARRLIDLARESMVTRARDLDVFAHGDPRDVRLVDCGEGLQFAVIGARPERRLLLEAVYGMLTLKNGVPVGYTLASALYRSSEVAYNVFETYRGAEAARIYGRLLATVRHLFGCDAFTIMPYQLGHENDEGLRSGAWWFYRKLGFSPRAPEAIRLASREARALRRDPGHRSDRATLEALATHNLFWWLGRPRDDVIGLLPLAGVGLAVMDYLARRFGSRRAAARGVCAREAARLLGALSLAGFTPDERLAWERWSPLILILPGLARWSAAEKRALVRVVRAKGGRRESDFVRLFDAHRRLRRAVAALARHGASGAPTA
jgi:hypothetical protein